jgi:hypothetical protein
MMSDNDITKWRVNGDERHLRCEFIGPRDFYFMVKQSKINQIPVGYVKIVFEPLGSNDYLKLEREAELMRAFQDALTVAREWAAPTKAALANETPTR